MKNCNKEKRWDFVDESKQKELGERFVAKNIAINTKWAVANFIAWKEARNTQFESEKDKLIMVNILEESDPTVVSKWLHCMLRRQGSKMGLDILLKHSIYY